MSRRDLRMGKRIVSVVMSMAVLATISPLILAAEPHEDPETAQPVFSGISLLRYYSDSLDFVLQKDPAEVEARLEKMPFANVPQSLKEATGSFAFSGISISHLVVTIDEDLNRLRLLRQQFRLDEARELTEQLWARLSLAHSELDQIERATETTGEELAIFSVPEGSDLRHSYDEVLDRIERIRAMLTLHEEVVESADITVEELLESTEITLKVAPTTAFVGDNIGFEGVLTSGKEALAGREVDILLNNSRYVTVRTDAYGHFQGVLTVPYWYVPELNLQALYYPRDEDVGFYISSLSPVITLKILFYQAQLEITAEDKAYPGLETVLSGRFDYGQSPPPDQREVEIYWNDVLITGFSAQSAFARRIQIDPAAAVGKHSITVSAAAAGRYSPVVTSLVLNVTRATPILDINTPKLAMMPWSIGVAGKVYSEVGPLDEASIRMRLGNSQADLVSSEDGTFDTRIKMGMGFGLIGSQDLTIQILPQEPWHAPLIATRAVVMVNVINLGIVLTALILLGIYLPGRLRRRLGAYPRKRARPLVIIPRSEPVPVYSDSVIVPAAKRTPAKGSREPRSSIFHWYRLVIIFIQGITRALLKPQQTLREFAGESSKVLGPAAQYFIEFTRMVESLLYSKYRPTEEDVRKSRILSQAISSQTPTEEDTDKSRRLSQTIEEELRGESI